MKDSSGGLRIGTVAERAGVSVQSLRYYERIGLLAEPPRSTSGYRQYPAEAVRTVRFIRRAQKLGMSLAEVGHLLRLRHHGASACSEVRALTDARLRKLDERVRSLSIMRDELSQLVRTCEENDEDGCCPVLVVLGDSCTAIAA